MSALKDEIFKGKFSYDPIGYYPRGLKVHMRLEGRGWMLRAVDLRSFSILVLKSRVKGPISLKVITSPLIVINLPWTYEKLHCKEEPYRMGS